MEKIKSIAIGIFLLIVGTTISNAQVNENQSKGPHNGVLQNAGDYNIEMIEGEKNCSFYVLDTKGKIVSNKGVIGTVAFELFNKTKLCVNRCVKLVTLKGQEYQYQGEHVVDNDNGTIVPTTRRQTTN